MTKEEAIENLKLVRLNAAMTGAASFKKAIDLAIVALSKPSLPSNLDEAAEEELGGDLCIKVSSTKEREETGNALYAGQFKKVYRCGISTANDSLL